MATSNYTFANQVEAKMGWRNHADPIIEGKLYLGKSASFLYMLP